MAEGFASKDTLRQVVGLLDAGKIGDAEALCRACVSRNAADVNMTAMLGAVLYKARKLEAAERYLRAAIRLADDFAKPYSDLGRLLLETGAHEESLRLLERAVQLDARDADAWFNLGRARAQAGDGPGADQAFERSFDLDPQRKALAYAAEHQQAGRWHEAEAEYRKVLSHNPRNVDALRLLAGCALQSRHALEAERLLRSAISIAPDFVEARLDLGRLLKEQNRLHEAIEQFEAAIRLQPNNYRGWFLLGSVLAPAARTRDAINAYRKVVELRPRHAGGWLGLGHVLKTAGQQDEAVAAYRKCIELKPLQGETWWSLANLKTWQFDDADLDTMRERLDDPQLAGEEHVQSRVNFLFALAKAWEDRGNFERAWRYYREGNETQRMHEHYDPVRTEVINDELIQVFSPDALARLGGQGHASNEPIFILGLPRSGSTLLEQILASHSQVEGTSELPYLGIVANSLNRGRADGVSYPQAIAECTPAQLRQLGQDYLDLARIHRSEGAPRFIDKMPNNFPSVGLLHLILPNCKIIDARRYPLDACLSCYRQLFARGQSFTYDLTDIGEYYLQYERMMDYWHEVLPGRVLTVQYEDMVTDFEAQVRRLLEFCQLPFEEPCLRFFETERPVRTASSEQVRQPVYSSSIHRWRRYAHELDELIEVLEPALQRYQRLENINR